MTPESPADIERLAAVKARHPGVEGIDAMSLTRVGGRLVFGLGDRVAAVQEDASDEDIDKAIQIIFGPDAPAADTVAAASDPAPVTNIDNQGGLTAPVAPPPARPTARKVAVGGFGASLRAMLEEARNGLDKAQTEGRQRVQEAVGKLGEATEKTHQVSTGIAMQIEDAASSALDDLRQISNDI